MQLTLTQAAFFFSYQEATTISAHHIVFMTTIASCGANKAWLLFALPLLLGA